MTPSTFCSVITGTRQKAFVATSSMNRLFIPGASAGLATFTGFLPRTTSARISSPPSGTARARIFSSSKPTASVEWT